MKAGDAIDVSRIEYDNLAAEVAKNTQMLARIEREVGVLRDAVTRIGHLVSRT